jgi:predicted small metal-binding protein
MKTLACRDAGFDCDTIMNGATEDEIIGKAENHALKEHSMQPEDISSEFKEKIRALITSSR